MRSIVPCSCSPLCAKSSARLSHSRILRSGLSQRDQDSRRASMGISLVGVPGWFLRIVRTVIDLDDHRLFMCDRRAVYVAFRIAVEAPGRERDLGRGVFVFAPQAEHELVRRMKMRLRNAGSLV